MKEKFITILIILLVLGNLFFFWKNKSINQELTKYKIENLKLDEKVKQLVKISNNKVQIVYRDRDVVRYVNIYVPPESPGATITTGDDGNVTVDVQRWGFTVKPFFGAGYNGKLLPLLGTRLVYFDRFGLGISASPETFNLFSDVRVENSILSNSSFGIFYGSDKSYGCSWHTFW